MNLSTKWKERIAHWTERPFLNKLLIWAVRLIVPRQRIGAVAVVVDSDGRILMLKHVFHPHAPWGLPGGWMKRNEAPADGVLREIKEETGLTAVIGSILLLTHDKHPPHVSAAYLAYADPSPMTLSAEIIDADWFAPDNLPAPLLPLHKKAVQAAML